MSESVLLLAAPMRRRSLALAGWLVPFTVLGSWLLASPAALSARALTVLTGILVAGVLGTYAPVGGRLFIGCTPCAVAAGASVPLAALLLADGRSDPAVLPIAAIIATFGLVQRLRESASCARP